MLSKYVRCDCCVVRCDVRCRHKYHLLNLLSNNTIQDIFVIWPTKIRTEMHIQTCVDGCLFSSIDRPGVFVGFVLLSLWCPLIGTHETKSVTGNFSVSISKNYLFWIFSLLYKWYTIILQYQLYSLFSLKVDIDNNIE